MGRIDQNSLDLRIRTRQLAVRIIKLCAALPKSFQGRLISSQLPRCGALVGAQYAEAYRAKSHPDFISKIEGATQELEETLFWIELTADLNLVKSRRLDSLRAEINELMAILVSMATRAKKKQNR